MTVASGYDCLLLDLDGTIWEGGRPIPGAIKGVQSTGLPLFYITNNASKAPSVVAEQLTNIGLPTAPDHVLTSAQAAIELASRKIPSGAKLLILGTDSFRELAREAGFVVVDSADDNPVAVLQGHNPSTGWAELSEASMAIHKGATYFASNLDTTLPQERGLAVGNGSMVAAVVSATGIVPEAAGKPKPMMFEVAASLLSASRPLAIGDRLDTDIAGGVAAGMDAFQVLTGVSGFYDVVNAPASQRATFLAESMLDLAEDSATLRPGAQGGFSAVCTDGIVELDGGVGSSTAIQALRTVVGAVWGLSDKGNQVREVRGISEHARRVLEVWW
ncbi:HAD-IIA family hydrolase [Corynebacterium freiburgense]|uniref:HAD-IIA family hydrolase n=1 Tax=Corynebacterium freiburgense TaxID=556548 RepID=UPI000400456E|nr:HAD-IIA family hydrolase [Corynebacterium freiburgense]WJZ02539.1 putative hydrolase YutF [Corynebacterium freiburgense]